MKVGLDRYNLSQSVFLEKVKSDLEFGVRIDSGQKEDGDVIRVWTDTKSWQFSLVGLIGNDQKIVIQKVEIQSFGSSIHYLKLVATHTHPSLEIDLQKLSPHFAEMSDVSNNEAQTFLDGYMQSTVNRTLTQELFSSFANEEDAKSWLSL